MNDNDPRPLGRGFAFAFVVGGALVFAALVDLVRFLFQWGAPITTAWLVVITFTGFALGGAAYLIVSRTLSRRTPTPNNRWRGP